MNFDLSDEQQMFKASVERFAPVEMPARRLLRATPGGYSRARWEELGALGLIALAVEQTAGGLGGSPVDLTVVANAIGHCVAPDPWLENGVLPACLLARGGRADDLATVLSGERLVAFAFAEREQRFNLTPSAVTARRSGPHFRLHGEKTFVLGGAQADQFIVTAACDGEMACFLVPGNREGVIRHAYRLVDGSIACELRLTDAEALAEERLALGSDDLADIVALVRLLGAAESLGLAERLFEETLAYVKQREQFGVPIGTFQALQHRLVDCYAALEQSRSTVLRAALAEPQDRAAWHRATAGAKAYVSAQADLVAREAVQMHGGMGITDELVIGTAMKRVLLLGRLFGDEQAVLAEFAEAA